MLNSSSVNTSCTSTQSNVGEFYFPPTDPHDCFVNVLFLDGLNYVGIALHSVSIINCISLRNLSRIDKLWVYCMILTNSGYISYASQRFQLSHSQHIQGKPEAKVATLLFLTGSCAFWVAVYSFMFKYFTYVRNTCAMALLAARSELIRLLRIMFLIGFMIVSVMLLLWTQMALGNEQLIRDNGLIVGILLECGIVFATLVAWPSASRSVKKDLNTFIQAQAAIESVSKISTAARHIHRAKRNLRNLNILTNIEMIIGLTSLLALGIRVSSTQLNKYVVYQVPFYTMVCVPITCTTMIILRRQQGFQTRKTTSSSMSSSNTVSHRYSKR